MISLSSFIKLYYTYILFMPFYYTNLYDIITRLKQKIHLHTEDSTKNWLLYWYWNTSSEYYLKISAEIYILHSTSAFLALSPS